MFFAGFSSFRCFNSLVGGFPSFVIAFSSLCEGFSSFVADFSSFCGCFSSFFVDFTSFGGCFSSFLVDFSSFFVDFTSLGSCFSSFVVDFSALCDGFSSFVVDFPSFGEGFSSFLDEFSSILEVNSCFFFGFCSTSSCLSSLAWVFSSCPFNFSTLFVCFSSIFVDCSSFFDTFSFLVGSFSLIAGSFSVPSISFFWYLLDLLLAGFLTSSAVASLFSSLVGLFIEASRGLNESSGVSSSPQDFDLFAGAFFFLDLLLFKVCVSRTGASLIASSSLSSSTYSWDRLYFFEFLRSSGCAGLNRRPGIGGGGWSLQGSLKTRAG